MLECTDARTMHAVEGRRERKKHELRQRVLDTAFELMAVDGIDDTRIESIAEQADIAQATFFNYFPSKASLVDALLGRVLDDLDGALASAQASNAAAGERIRLIFSTSADLKSRQRRLMRDLIAEASRASTDHGPMSRLRATFCHIIELGQDTGEFRRDQSPDLLADAVVGMYNGIVLRWSHEDDFPVADRLATAADMVIELLGARAT